MLFQLINKQRGINKVVNRRKNNEIPSIPSVMFRFKTGIHRILVTNWKVPTDFLKPPHMNRNTMKGMQEKFKATTFNKFCCSGFINISNKIPINGIRDV
jgi:hypothetical protein